MPHGGGLSNTNNEISCCLLHCFCQSWFLRHTFLAFFGEKLFICCFFFVKWAWQLNSLGHTHVLFSLLFAVYIIIWATFQRTDQINCITFREKSGMGYFWICSKYFEIFAKLVGTIFFSFFQKHKVALKPTLLAT